jgi:hypothetical protein
MKRDAIDELAAELFAAARAERPDRGLLERVEASAADGPGTTLERGAAVERFRATAARNVARGPARPFRWLLAAVVFAGVTVVVASQLGHDEAQVTLSAEQPPAAGRRSDPLPSVAHLPSAPPGLELPGTGTSPAADPARPELVPSPPRAMSETESAPGRAPREPPSRIVTRGEARTPASTPGAPPPAASTPSAPAPATPAPATPAPATPAPTPTRDPSREAAEPSANTLATELAFVKQVRSALRGRDGGAALTLLDRYDTGAYGRALSVEATLLRVEALDALGRRAEASALARRFVAENPDSPLAERAQSFIVDGPAPAATAAPRREPPIESAKPGP